MQLLQFKKDSYEVTFTEECSMTSEFKKILSRDRSKDKSLAIKEITFVYFYSDITSPYQNIIDDEERSIEIIKDIDLPKNWKIDKVIEDAISFYKQRSRTVVHSLYDAAMVAVSAVNDTLKNAKTLILEADDNIAAAQKVLATIEKVPKVMQNLRDAEKELIRQIEDKEGKKIGSKQFNTFEDIDGLMK